MNKNFFSIRTWLSRFGYAINGLKFSFAAEHSIWLHLSATLLVIMLAIIKDISIVEAVMLTFTIGSVWAAELFNTAIEKLADKVCADYNTQIKIIKDLAAAAVLVTSLTALITGLIIFIPKFR